MHAHPFCVVAQVMLECLPGHVEMALLHVAASCLAMLLGQHLHFEELPGIALVVLLRALHTYLCR